MDGVIGANDEAPQGSMSFSLLEEIPGLYRGNVQKPQTDLGDCDSEVANGDRQDTADALDVHHSQVAGTAMPGDTSGTPALAHVDVGSPPEKRATSRAVNEAVFDQQAGSDVRNPHESAETAAAPPMVLISTPSKPEEGAQLSMAYPLQSESGANGREEDSDPNASVPAGAAPSGTETATSEPPQPELKPDPNAEPKSLADPNEADVAAAGSVGPWMGQLGGPAHEQDASGACDSGTSEATAGLGQEIPGDEQAANGMPTVVSGPGGAVEISAYSATLAILNKLIAAGAAGARSLAEMAGRVGASPGYRAATATSNAIRAAHPDRSWTGVECVRLTICSDETLPIYLENKVIKLRSQCFGHSDEIMTSGRTALVLYNVDSKQVIGVWTAIAKDNEFIMWQVLKNLSGMPCHAFQASPAGAVFPELPPTDTAVRARGDAARTVLRVLFEYAATSGDGAGPAGMPGNLVMLGPAVGSDQNVDDDVVEDSRMLVSVEAEPDCAAGITRLASDEAALPEDQSVVAVLEATTDTTAAAFVGFEVGAQSTVATVPSTQTAQECALSLEEMIAPAPLEVAVQEGAAEAQAVDTVVPCVETEIAVVDGSVPGADEAEPEGSAADQQALVATAEQAVAALEGEVETALEREVRTAVEREVAAEAEREVKAIVARQVQAEAEAAKEAEATREAKAAREAEATAAPGVEVQQEEALEAEVEMPAEEVEPPTAVLVPTSAVLANSGVTPRATGSSVTDAAAAPTEVVATATAATETVTPTPVVLPAQSPSSVASGPAVFPYNPVMPLVRVLSSQLRAASPTTATSAPAAVVPVVAVPVTGMTVVALSPVVQAAPIVVATAVVGAAPRPLPPPAAGDAASRAYMPPFFFLQQQRMAAAAAAAQPQTTVDVAPPQPAASVPATQPATLAAAPLQSQPQPTPSTQAQPAQEIEQERQTSQTVSRPSSTEPRRAVSKPLMPSEVATAQSAPQTQLAAPQATRQVPQTTAQATEAAQPAAQPQPRQRNPSTSRTQQTPQPAQAVRPLRSAPAAAGTLAPVPTPVVGQQPKPIVVRQNRGPTPVRIPTQVMTPTPVTSAAQFPAPTSFGASPATAPAPTVSVGASTSSDPQTPVSAPAAPSAGQAPIRPLNFLAVAAGSIIWPVMAGPNQQIVRPLQTPPAGVQISNWPVMAGAAPPPPYGVRPSNTVAMPLPFNSAAAAPPVAQPWGDAPAVALPPALATEAPSEGSAARLICPLCQQRTGCWFLLSCSHMGPCEECCGSVEQVKAAYPNCARCGKAVCDKIMKARVS